ncbi:hypothetical protein HMP0721_0099 [Pseudoramibacter alactolyticus ATCC 23263]|uniref:Uncharacterized protein n=1 Tax=Pseudoramibacter alactolyticus ATCC 23263 TaxID=887929 RepID=E6MDL7_9FIRM|nr:hypothetical protein HMP0721_0099 [Pseudoramibacter alactolyticus ATCC 23263]
MGERIPGRSKLSEDIAGQCGQYGSDRRRGGHCRALSIGIVKLYGASDKRTGAFRFFCARRPAI